MAERTSIFHLSRERREAGLALSLDMDDRVCQDEEQLHLWYVSSASEPGTWHTVDTRTGECDCKASQYRGYCRHAARIWWEVDRQRKEESTHTASQSALVA